MTKQAPNCAKPLTVGRVLVPYREARQTLGGISAPTLYKMLGNGDLDRVVIGRRVFITAESIDRFVQRQVNDFHPSSAFFGPEVEKVRHIDAGER